MQVFQLPFLISRGRNSDFLCKFFLRECSLFPQTLQSSKALLRGTLIMLSHTFGGRSTPYERKVL